MSKKYEEWLLFMGQGCAFRESMIQECFNVPCFNISCMSNKNILQYTIENENEVTRCKMH